jgi:hypothetical protein
MSHLIYCRRPLKSEIIHFKTWRLQRKNSLFGGRERRFRTVDFGGLNDARRPIQNTGTRIESRTEDNEENEAP